MIKRQLADGRTVTARSNGGIRKRCGCPRSVWTKSDRCTHPWHANYSYGGLEHRVSLHKWAKKPAGYVMLQKEAKTLFRQWQDAIEGGQTTAPLPANKLTFDAIANTYITAYVQHPDRRKTSQKEMGRQVNVWIEAFGTSPIASITKAMIEDYRLERRQAHDARMAVRAQVDALKAAGEAVPPDLRKQAQVAARSTKAGRVSMNRLLERLRHLFGWAIEKGYVETSPFVKCGQAVIHADQKAEGSRSRRLEEGEEERLLAAAGPHLRACIEATLDTGMRKGEILGLRWRDVNLRKRQILVPASVAKTETARVVMFSGTLAAILEMRQTAPDGQQHGPDAFVFGDECGGRIQSFKTAWRLTCQRAGITGLTFHDLRRESGSRMLDAGNSLTDVRDFLGHTDVSQTNVYLASTPQRMRAAIEKRDLARTKLAQSPTAETEASEAPTVTH